ncbi:MAG: polysaccharide biosynthesis protein [Lachnospiraceae bacterium]|nr:polysaccharide biosynthesis protein [Lachnospiraceae bacterium]
MDEQKKKKKVTPIEQGGYPDQLWKKGKGIQHWQILAILMAVYDIVFANLSYLFGLWARYDFRYSTIPEEYLQAALRFIPIYSGVILIVFSAHYLYQSIWRFASYKELIRLIGANAITFLAQVIGITLMFKQMPFAYYFFGVVLQFFFTTAVRFFYRFVLLERSKRVTEKYSKKVMIIGAGEAGQVLLRDIYHADEIEYKVCCFIDDNPNKWHRNIEGIPVYGGRDDILKAVDKYGIDLILIAMPSASRAQTRDLLDICKETGCEMKLLPGMYQFLTGDVALSKMKEVAVEDLLGREPIKVNLTEILNSIEGKVVMVTGGGGSIGSELCRQIAGHNPERLIIFDVYENNAYDIEQELKSTYSNLNLTVLIGSVRDSRRLNSVFEKYRPEIVYHAAAHKHVPLMETSPCESIKNNVIGTFKTACAAMTYGTKRFVLISTDKAVNPTNIMGASKRLCEMVIQSMDFISREGRQDILPNLSGHNDETDSKQLFMNRHIETRTEFVAVRFGNVLGSNGSVIPLFKKQIAKGGPVTVTHPDIIRYFMTIPEAVSLVLQAGTYAKGGEIFVLDMGEPVKIDTLARNLIKLCGYKPDVDIKIQYTGLRPGEKLYEEKLMAEEGIERTANELIHIGKPIAFDMVNFMGQLEELAEASYNNDEEIRRLVKSIVTTYHPSHL